MFIQATENQYDRPETLLRNFDSISLEEMDNVSLMNRTDTKFFFHSGLLPLLFNSIENDYRILTISDVRLNTYNTLYFDTPDYFLYNEHHRGKAQRLKVRYRKYCNTEKIFFEIKHKNNKGRTNKERIETENFNQSISGKCKRFLECQTKLHADELKPSLGVTFQRMTLVNKFLPERIIIDTDLRFHLNGEHEGINLNRLVIVELKQDRLIRSEIDSNI